MDLELKTGRSVEKDARGAVVSRAAQQRRGEIAVGQKLRQERAREDAAGRPHRKLNMTELRCLMAAQEAEIRGERA
jgi:hypothetical protein